MTPAHKAELERVAREFLEAHPMSIATTEEPECVEALVTLLAAQRVKVLEEVAEAIARMSPTYMDGMERWLRGEHCTDGKPKRVLDLAPHLERQRVAELAMQGRRDENTFEMVANWLRSKAQE